MEYSLDDYVKSIVYYTRGEYIEKIISSRREPYYAIYQVRTNKDEYVIKLFPEEKMGEIEENALYYLRKASNIRVPKVYNVYEKNDDIPYSAVIMEKIADGNILTRISKKIRTNIIDDIIENLLYKEQDYDINSFGEIGREKYHTWQEYYKKRAFEDTEKAKALLINKRIPIDTYLKVQNMYFNFDEIFSEKVDRATLIHGNCSIDNIFFNKEGRAVAIINPHIAMYGDKEYETISLDPKKNGGIDILSEYLRRVDMSKNFYEKYEFYYLYDKIERMFSELNINLKKKKHITKYKQK